MFKHKHYLLYMSMHFLMSMRSKMYVHGDEII